MKDLAPIIGNNLAKLRKAKNLTQGQLAELFSYSDKSISKWEHGEAVPDVNTLQELANYYGVTIDYLTHEETDASLIDKGSRDPKTEKANKIIITALAISTVWTFATVLYATFSLFPTGWPAYMAFVWAFPLSFLILIPFGIRWWGRKTLLVSVYGLIWTTLLSVYLEIGFDIPDYRGWASWFLLLIGVPITIGIALASRYRKH